MTTLANRSTAKREPPQTQTQRRVERPATHRVRIAVLMAPSREWDCRGWGYQAGNNETDAVLESELRNGAVADELEAGARVYWIEADVPVPAPVEVPGVIKGTVTEAKNA